MVSSSSNKNCIKNEDFPRKSCLGHNNKLLMLSSLSSSRHHQPQQQKQLYKTLQLHLQTFVLKLLLLFLVGTMMSSSSYFECQAFGPHPFHIRSNKFMNNNCKHVTTITTAVSQRTNQIQQQQNFRLRRHLNSNQQPGGGCHSSYCRNNRMLLLQQQQQRDSNCDCDIVVERTNMDINDNNNNNNQQNRRKFFVHTASQCMFLSTSLIGTTGIMSPQPVSAAESIVEDTVVKSVELPVGISDNPRLLLRRQLLEAIDSKSASEETILSLIEQLVPYDPSKAIISATPNKEQQQQLLLDGVWELLWSAKAEAFSPLLKLPVPFKPNSYQYIGTPAELEVGSGRLAQGLTGGLLLGTKQLWLSSGYTFLPQTTTATSTTSSSNTIVIQPPFRFEIGGPYGSGIQKQMVVEAGSDAEFRKVNARTITAQQAGQNIYEQLYVEENTNDEDGQQPLRISTITSGDPVIVGAIFVHRKISM